MSELWNTVGPYIADWLYLIPVVVLSLTIHEFCHAYVAVELGDPTPRYDGRLSLNPFHHIDIIGFIVMLVAHFGWAKPVRVNPMYFENPRKGMMYTAIAGPISNLVICTVSSLIFFFSFVFRGPLILTTFFYYMTMLNAGLAVFNLIPIHPLDGSRVVGYFFPRFASFMARYGNTVQLIFFALLILPSYISVPGLDFLNDLIITVQSGIVRLLIGLWSAIFKFLL